jgi:hypothetical protein
MSEESFLELESEDIDRAFSAIPRRDVMTSEEGASPGLFSIRAIRDLIDSGPPWTTGQAANGCTTVSEHEGQEVSVSEPSLEPD